MIRRKGVPDGGCSMCCRLKQKLDELWQRTSGCILKIRGITPDGQGDFALEAGQNVNISEVPNGLKISTTGGVSYYEPADGYVNIDNDTLEIGVNAGVPDGLATQNDLETVASAITNIIDGTTQVADAAHADSADSATSATNATNTQYLGSSSTNAGSDTKPVKIVNGQAVEVTDSLQRASQYYTFSDNLNVPPGQESQATAHDLRAGVNIIIANAVFNSGSGIGGFVFGVNIDGITTWCQSMYQIPANDTVRISFSIAYSKNTAHQFAIKVYSTSNITGANVNTKVISL